MLTAIEQNLEFAKYLVENGADINARALHEYVRDAVVIYNCCHRSDS